MQETSGARARSWSAAGIDPMLIAVSALGVTQITAWGTSYYCLGVLAGPIAADTGWSRSFVFLGFSIALVVMGLVSTSVGRAIDRYGARSIMSAGTVIVSAGLYGLSLAASPSAYLAVWALIGLGMRLCLYDAAFAALVQITPTRGRKAISLLTLPGAFASSFFWVIGHYLNESVGWRQTLVLFAVINLVLCLPLHWFGLARREAPVATEATAATTKAPETPVLQGRQRTIGMALFALVMSLNGFVFGVVSVQLVPLLEAAGLGAALAVWVASMKGYAQFGGRVVEILFGSHLKAMTVARIAIGILPLSLALLLAGTGNVAAVIAFTLLMGASQGVITIVRGAVPLALFGAKGYGAVLGAIATPILLVNAFSPTVFAMMVETWGWARSEYLLLGCATAAWLTIELMARWYSRAGTSASAVRQT
ncbi:MAG TPA: MFS transporter [Hyphomicrobiaceae bacterium]|nr:MFS transporter [Hyphomicrobiaceae bacterium]